MVVVAVGVVVGVAVVVVVGVAVGVAVAVGVGVVVGVAVVTESEILAACRKAANDFPELVLWRLSYTGTVERNGAKWKGGLSVNGGSDLIGVLTVDVATEDAPVNCVAFGRFIAIEIKTPPKLANIRRHVAKGTTAKLTKTERAQLMFLALARAHGGFGAFVDSEQAFRDAIGRALAGESE